MKNKFTIWQLKAFEQAVDRLYYNWDYGISVAAILRLFIGRVISC